MAGFSSQDDLINQVSTNSKFFRADWNKNFLPTTAATAGEWHCLFRGGGNPGADAIANTGTNLAFQALTDATANATGIQHGGNVGGGTGFKHVLNASAFSAAATTMPCVFMLVDLLGFYRVTSVTTTGDQATNNTVTIPRYTTGEGVQAFAYANNATPLGAATPNLRLTYTDSDGNAGNLTPNVLPACKTAAANGLILYSGTGAGKYGPFIPLATGDKGIRSIQQINLSAPYGSGEFSVMLCKPIFTLPMTTIGVAAERDFLNQLPSLPKVYDGACLAWLMYSAAATPTNSAFYGHMDFGWS
jgi:hypothetical protein